MGTIQGDWRSAESVKSVADVPTAVELLASHLLAAVLWDEGLGGGPVDDADGAAAGMIAAGAVRQLARMRAQRAYRGDFRLHAEPWQIGLLHAHRTFLERCQEAIDRRPGGLDAAACQAADVKNWIDLAVDDLRREAGAKR